MGIVSKIIMTIIKEGVTCKGEYEWANELADLLIEWISEKSVGEFVKFINGGKSKITYALSKEKMKSMNVSEDHVDFVVEEIKMLLSETEFTDEILRTCNYDQQDLSDFLWEEYCKDTNDHMEFETDIKRGLLVVAEAIIGLAQESDNFQKKFLIQISNSVDDINGGLQKLSDDIEENFSKLATGHQDILEVLKMMFEQKKIEQETAGDQDIMFKNNKKQDYIKNWNRRMFLHLYNDENPITLADAFIMPDYDIYCPDTGVGITANDTLEQTIENFINSDRTSTTLITGVAGMGKTAITSWLADKYKADNNIIILRFRDWEAEELEKGLLSAIFNTLKCKKQDLDNKILILDGFDELKSLNIRHQLLEVFFNDLNDFENLKCIVTSRPDYIRSDSFQNVYNLRVFDIKKVEIFCKNITGKGLDKKKKIESNLEVLGIPVILYLALMSNVDIYENPTKPELYNRIFAEKGGYI